MCGILYILPYEDFRSREAFNVIIRLLKCYRIRDCKLTKQVSKDILVLLLQLIVGNYHLKSRL